MFPLNRDELKAYIAEKILRRDPREPVKALIKQVGTIDLITGEPKGWHFDCRNGAAQSMTTDHDGTVRFAGWTLAELYDIYRKARALL